MNIYVVIVTYNGAAWIRLALESLRNSQIKCTTIIVDNNSNDNTVELVKNEFPETVLLIQNKNNGFGIGNNIGISYALNLGADFIFLLNQDAYVTPAAIGELTSFLQQHNEYAVVTPLHCSPNLERIDPNTQKRYLQGYASAYISDACLGTVREYYDIYGINAAAWMVRAGAFKITGGFDPLFFMYGEDDDLINRFNYFGQRFALLPTSKIVHLRAKSPSKKNNVFQELWVISERAKSSLLVDAKLPTGSFLGKLIRLIVNGIATPFLNLLTKHCLLECIGYIFATIKIIFSFREIVNKSKQCAKRGPHYLEINS